MKRVLSLTLSVALAAAAVTVATAAPAVAATEPGVAGAYRGLATPARALDTRTQGGGPALSPGETRPLLLAAYGITSTATAVVLNVTVASATSAGYLTVYPQDAASRPLASTINFRAGEIRSNNATVALPTTAGSAPTVDIFNFAGTTQVVVDVLGYYDPAANGAGGSNYVAVPAFRAFDSRSGTTPSPVRPGGARTVSLVPGIEGVTAVAVNLTAVNPTGQGFLTAYSGSGTRPSTSSVNYGTDPVTPNFAIVPVQVNGASVTIQVDNSGSQTDVVVDVVGYYTTNVVAGSSLYAPVTPLRSYDSRDGKDPLGSDETRTLGVPGHQNAVGVNLNVTAVDATLPTFLTVYPFASPSRPGVSNLNPFTPFALANAVQTGTVAQTAEGSSSSADLFWVYNLRGSVDVVVDLQGYFLPFG